MAIPNKNKSGAIMGEENTRKPTAEAGLYRHPNGKTILVANDPLWGDAQAQAAMRVGFTYERPAYEGEVVHTVASNVNEKVSMSEGDLKGIQARLNALEAENQRLKNQVATGNPVPGTEPVLQAEDHKAEAQRRVDNGQAAGLQNGQDAGDPTAGTKLLAEQNRTELENTARAGGLTDEQIKAADTKAKLRDLIETGAEGENN